MRAEAAWQLDVRPAGADTLCIVLGGRWRIDRHLPSADSLEARLEPPLSRLRFDASELTDWDSGLLAFVSGISKSCAERGIAVDDSGLPPGARRLLAMARAVPEQKLGARDDAAQGLFAPEEGPRLADIEKLIKRKIERVEITGFAELAPVRESAPSNRGHRREHLERARERARERDRSLTREGIRPAGRELPSPAAHVPRLDPRLPKLDFDPNKPYVSKTVGIEIPTDRPAPTRPQRPVAALLGGFGKK